MLFLQLFDLSAHGGVLSGGADGGGAGGGSASHRSQVFLHFISFFFE